MIFHLGAGEVEATASAMSRSIPLFLRVILFEYLLHASLPGPIQLLCNGLLPLLYFIIIERGIFTEEFIGVGAELLGDLIIQKGGGEPLASVVQLRLRAPGVAPLIY